MRNVESVLRDDEVSGVGVTQIFGISGWSTANFYRGNPGGGPRGSASGFWIFLLMRRTGNTADVPFQVGGVTRGYLLRTTTGGSSNVVFRVQDGVGANVESPAGTVAVSDGIIHGVLCFTSGTLVELYVDRVRIGLGTAIVGYTPPVGGDPPFLGCSQANLFPFSGNILGIAGGDAAFPTDAQAKAYFDDVKASRRVTTMAGVTTTHIWDVQRNGRGVPTVWDEELGTGDIYNKFGGAGLTEVVIPEVWGW